MKTEPCTTNIDDGADVDALGVDGELHPATKTTNAENRPAERLIAGVQHALEVVSSRQPGRRKSEAVTGTLALHRVVRRHAPHHRHPGPEACLLYTSPSPRD